MWIRGDKSPGIFTGCSRRAYRGVLLYQRVLVPRAQLASSLAHGRSPERPYFRETVRSSGWEVSRQRRQRSLPSFVGAVQVCGWVCTVGRQQELRGHVKLDRSRYISIPEGEGQFVPVIWRVHGDSLTVIQSLATLSLSLSFYLFLHEAVPSPSPFRPPFHRGSTLRPVRVYLPRHPPTRPSLVSRH